MLVVVGLRSTSIMAFGVDFYKCIRCVPRIASEDLTCAVRGRIAIEFIGLLSSAAIFDPACTA